MRAPVAHVRFSVIARFGNDGQRDSLRVGQERNHRGYGVFVADHRQMRQSLTVHVGQVEIGLDGSALKESRNAAPGQLLFGKRGRCRRRKRIVACTRCGEGHPHAQIARMDRVGPPFGGELSGFARGFETEGVAASVHFLRYEPEGFARAVQRHGGGGFAVARGDAVETVDVEAQRVAAPVDDGFSLRRRRFRCVEHGISAVGSAPDERLPFVAELYSPGLPAFAAFLPRNVDPGIADARTVSEEG